MGHVVSKSRSLGQIEGNLVNTVNAAFFVSGASNLVRMFILMISCRSLNTGYARSKRRSLGQIDGKSC